MPKIIITEPCGKATKFQLPLDKKEIRIGSMVGNHIVLISSKASSNHCVVIRNEFGYLVKDLDSSYGTSFNGKKFTTLQISKDKSFSIADVHIKFQFAEDELTEFTTNVGLAGPPPPEKSPKKKATKASKKKATKAPTPPNPAVFHSEETIRAVQPTKVTKSPAKKPAVTPKKTDSASPLPLAKTPKPWVAPKDLQLDPSESEPSIATTENSIPIPSIQQGYIIDFEMNLERAEIRTKFGGFPDWLGNPEWPIIKGGKTPMRFIGQFKIDPKLFPNTKAKMAYFFMKDRETPTSILHQTAVILQPGDNKHVTSIPEHNGPSLQWLQPRKGYKTKLFPEDYRQSPDLVPVTKLDIDEAHSSAEPLNKVGGPPDFITGSNFPDDKSKWHLLFQINKNTVPFEIDLAEHGVCFGFLREDGKQARVVVQRR